MVIAEYLEERINYSDESKKTVTNDNMFNYIRCGRDTAVCFSSITYYSIILFLHIHFLRGLSTYVSPSPDEAVCCRKNGLV